MIDATDLACAALPCPRPAQMLAGVPLCGHHLLILKTEVMRPVLTRFPAPLIAVDQDVLERFAARIRIGDDACKFRWIDPDRSSGYGRFRFEGRDRGAHVMSHLLFVGPIPDGYHVDHVRKRGCMHRDCVWWEHLEAVPPIENYRRGDAGLGQSSKTHCPAGHEYSAENIYWRSDGGRGCKTCVKEKALARYRRLVNPNPNPDPSAAGRKGGATRGAQQRAKTHCPQGHEYTEDNIYRTNGGRKCKTCTKDKAAERSRRMAGDPEFLARQREYQRDWRARKSSERLAEGMADGIPTGEDRQHRRPQAE